MKLDLTYLQSISGGDIGFIKEVMRLFLEHTVPDSQTLKSLIEANNWGGVSSGAHKLKSSIAMFGNQEILDRVIFIEKSSKHPDDCYKIPAVMNQLEKDIEWLAREIRQFIDEN